MQMIYVSKFAQEFSKIVYTKIFLSRENIIFHFIQMLASWFVKMKLKSFKGRSFDDSIYEEVTDEEWRILRTHTAQTRRVKKNSELVIHEDMLFMQTNVLSPIPECFDLDAPRVPERPARDLFKDSRPPKVQVKKRPPNEPLVRTKSDEQKIQLRERAKKFKSEKAGSRNNQNGMSTASKAQGARVRFTEDAPQDAQSGSQAYTYKKTKSKIRWKTKTKIRRHMWRTKSAPVLNRMSNVEEEMTSCTEFSQETNISFAAYMKKRTPSFGQANTASKSKSKKLKRTEATQNLDMCGFTGRNEELCNASEKNITFNPIFKDDENEKKEDHVYYRTPVRGDHVGDHVKVSKTPKIYFTKEKSYHVQSSCSNKQEKYGDEINENQVPSVTCIDQNLDESENENHVPVTCIDECNDDIYEDHVENKDNHVRKPCLLRSGHIEDLDMCNWYNDDKDDDDDDDDFTSRMLRRTPAIVTFDLTYRRRELYTIEEEPEE